MNDTLVLFKTELPTLNAFSKELQAGFEALGYDIFEFDVEKTAVSMGLLYEYMKEHKVIALIGFNNRTVTATTPSGANIWETLGIFCINILVDHPYWYHDILIKMPKFSAVLCIDRNHMNYVSRFYPDIAITGFLPHGAIENETVKGYEERRIEALYAGSLYKSSIDEIDYSIWNFDVKSVVSEVTDFLIANPEYTVEKAIEEALVDKGISLPDNQLRLFISYNVNIERTVSAYYREKLMRHIAESGIEVTIYGAGWEECDFIKLKNVYYEGFISAKEIEKKVGESKAIINSMPWFKDGSHERIFLGMLNGAVVMTEENAFLREISNEKPDDAFISYSLNDDSIISACEKLKSIVRDKSSYESITSKARNLAANKHSWKDRAKEIHEALLNQGDGVHGS